MRDYKQIETYEEAVSLINDIGILPIFPLIPNYPSLHSLTLDEHWFSRSEFDPWLWRVRFPNDGSAAYGKFIKKKATLISKELFPLVKAIAGSPLTVEKRYKEGALAKTTADLYPFIVAEEGIETQALKSQSGMKAKEMKSSFDQALLSLQGSMDIVISGAAVRRNKLGEETKGWNSTSFETAEHWMDSVGIENYTMKKENAKKELLAHLVEICSPEAMAFFKKYYNL